MTKVLYIFFLLMIFLKYVSLNLQLSRRIIGGVSADITEIPYQVSIEDSIDHICGGSIIHSLYILTAAHCLEWQSSETIKVRMGSTYLTKGGIVKKVCSIMKHPKYIDSDENFDNDVAILKLCEKIDFSNNAIKPIAIPEYDEIVPVGTPAVVSGWGYTHKGSYLSETLQKVTLVINNQTECQQKYKNLALITVRMLCASCLDGICDACQGDSGGPLTANGKLIGIVSWGEYCANKYYPGVYTKVSKFVPWIKSRII